MQFNIITFLREETENRFENTILLRMKKMSLLSKKSIACHRAKVTNDHFNLCLYIPDNLVFKHPIRIKKDVQACIVLQILLRNIVFFS